MIPRTGRLQRESYTWQEITEGYEELLAERGRGAEDEDLEPTPRFGSGQRRLKPKVPRRAGGFAR